MTDDQQALADLGALLRQRREEHGRANHRTVTQREVAVHVGVHHTFWSRVEAGLARPSIQVLIRAAELLDIDLGALEPLKQLGLRLPHEPGFGSESRRLDTE